MGSHHHANAVGREGLVTPRSWHSDGALRSSMALVSPDAPSALAVQPATVQLTTRREDGSQATL